jgi:predicted TIM-barrel fold metal-dependent hydrolase
MDSFRVQRSLVMPPPGPFERSNETAGFMAVVQRFPDRFAYLAAGDSLNAMIQQALRSGTVSPQLREGFQQTAEALIRGGAVGFGETTALHLSFNPSHPFETAPPDHALFLLLADIAARLDVPIDLHMEAVLQDKPPHPRLVSLSRNNPPTLIANIAGFERLLQHNRNARIVWAHVGWDNTGDMTVGLLRRLLGAHPNVYLQLKIDNPPATFPANRPLDSANRLKPEWLDLIRSFPDRFVMGSDIFYTEAGTVSNLTLQPLTSLLSQLPPDLALKVGLENPVRIYKLR